MKKALTICIVLIIKFGYSQSSELFFKDANTFFNSYVSDGKVDYTAVSTKGKMELSNLIDYLANNSYDKTIEKAYLINAYNLFVIDEISTHYPIASPMDVPGFFDNKNSILNGNLISLNSLENDLLRKVYKDARLHFVLVCGAISCPPIVNFAYTPSLLEKQLESQTSKAINNETFIYEKDGVIHLSEIFKWYSSDFGKNNTQIIEYINKYKNEKFNSDRKITHYTYNWAVNNIQFIKYNGEDNSEIIHQTAPCVAESENNNDEVGGQTFNAGSLLRKNQFDYTLFNTLYTQTKSNWLGVDYTGNRATFNTHLIQVTYGVSKNKRINIGLDINFKSSGSSTDSTVSGISTAFDYKNTATTRVGVTSVGLRLKLQPFKTVSNFTLQSTLLAPTIKFAEGGGNSDLYWADWERVTWWNQFFYTKSFGKFQLFAEFDMLFRFKIYDNQISMLDMPMSAFISYFPTKKITVYAMSQHVPRFTNDIKPQTSSDWVVPSNYTASGLGFKYQINRGLNIELLYTNFWRGTNSGLGSTFNVGIKYITK